jgi:hypothetical protein
MTTEIMMGTPVPLYYSPKGDGLMVKKYTVDLTAEERQQVLELTCKGKASARKIKRAQILLLAHAGMKPLQRLYRWALPL